MHSSIHSSRHSLDGYLAQATPGKTQLQVASYIGIACHNVTAIKGNVINNIITIVPV